MRQAYIALFCPHCGTHVNEDELENDHGIPTDAVARARRPEGDMSGSPYTCGWCKTRTTDWNHVLECRAKRNPSMKTLRGGHLARGVDLQRLLDEMDP